MREYRSKGTSVKSRVGDGEIEREKEREREKTREREEPQRE